MSSNTNSGNDSTTNNNGASGNELPMASLITGLNESLEQILRTAPTTSISTSRRNDLTTTNTDANRVDDDENDETGVSKVSTTHPSSSLSRQQQFLPNRLSSMKAERNVSSIPENPRMANHNMNDENDDDDDEDYHCRSSNSPQQSSIITTSSTSATTNYSGSTITNTPGRNDSSSTLVLQHNYQQQRSSALSSTSSPALPELPRNYSSPAISITLSQQQHRHQSYATNTATSNISPSTPVSVNPVIQHQSLTTSSNDWATSMPPHQSESSFRSPMKVIQEQRQTATSDNLNHDNKSASTQERDEEKVIIYDVNEQQQQQQQLSSSLNDNRLVTSMDSNDATPRPSIPKDTESQKVQEQKQQVQPQPQQHQASKTKQQSHQDGSISAESSSNSTIIAIKMLISNNIAGSIIGRMGQSISELQVESQTRIKISQSSDYYPGTQDRVCLIQGSTLEAVKIAVRLIVHRCYQIQQSEHMQQHQGIIGYGMVNPPILAQQQMYSHAESLGDTKNAIPVLGGGGFDFVLRLLVPVTCCGMIIGKSGTNIKYMEEASGVLSVRLSSKDDSAGYNTGTAFVLVPTNERIITITCLNAEQCVQCIHIVLDGMMSHPEISTYTNMTTSYVQHNPMNNHHRHQQAVVYPVLSNAVMMSQQPQVHQQIQRRAYHHVPHDQQHMYWETGGTNLFNATSPSVHIAPSQQLANTEGMNRRIASSPNLPLNFQEVSGIGRVAALHHQQEPPYQPSSSQSGQSNLIQARGFVHQNTTSQVALTSSAPVTSLSTQSSISNQQRYSTYHQYPTAYRPGNTFVSSQPGSAAIPHSTSAPNLIATQSLVVSQEFDGRMNPSDMLPSSSPAISTTNLLHQSVFQHHVSQSQYHVVSNDSSLVPNATAAALALQVPTMVAPGCFTAQVLVPDTMIGSILGRGGRTLTELQMMSGTIIRISQRNEYMPGTRSRIVTIRGPNTQSVWQAQYMISQRMTSVLTASGSSQPVGYPAAATSNVIATSATASSTQQQPVTVSSSTTSTSTPSPTTG